MTDTDQCIFCHEDLCTMDGFCIRQAFVIQNGVRQTFPMCNMTSDELWEQIAKEDSKNWGMNTK